MLLATNNAAPAVETALNEAPSGATQRRPEGLETTPNPFPQRLHARRRTRGWICQELATVARVTSQFLRRVEAGQRVPTPRVALQLAATLDVSAEGRVYVETHVEPVRRSSFSQRSRGS